MSEYDFERPFIDHAEMNVFVTDDSKTKLAFGPAVRAAELSNVEYKHRFQRLGSANNMKPPPSTGRIFSGYVVVRRLGTPAQYETWMPDHVFENLYRADQGDA